jgi:hypothetical protein
VGNDATQVIQVNIANNKSFSTLKKAIKGEKRPELNHLTADSLHLWKVSLPVDHNLRECLTDLDLADDSELSSVDDLLNVFPDSPTHKHVHIVAKSLVSERQSCGLSWHPLILSPLVARPALPSTHPLTLNCIVQGDQLTEVFTVEIPSTKNVDVLKDFIKDKKKHAFEQVDANTLRLWKVSIPVDTDFKDNVKKVELKDEEVLLPVDRLSTVLSV